MPDRISGQAIDRIRAPGDLFGNDTVSFPEGAMLHAATPGSGWWKDVRSAFSEPKGCAITSIQITGGCDYEERTFRFRCRIPKYNLLRNELFDLVRKAGVNRYFAIGAAHRIGGLTLTQWTEAGDTDDLQELKPELAKAVADGIMAGLLLRKLRPKITAAVRRAGCPRRCPHLRLLVIRLPVITSVSRHENAIVLGYVKVELYCYADPKKKPPHDPEEAATAFFWDQKEAKCTRGSGWTKFCILSRGGGALTSARKRRLRRSLEAELKTDKWEFLRKIIANQKCVGKVKCKTTLLSRREEAGASGGVAHLCWVWPIKCSPLPSETPEQGGTGGGSQGGSGGGIGPSSAWGTAGDAGVDAVSAFGVGFTEEARPMVVARENELHRVGTPDDPTHWMPLWHN